MGSIRGTTYPGFCVGGKNPLATMWILNIRRSERKEGSDVRRDCGAQREEMVTGQWSRAH